jgi:hypothetical protein
MQFSERPPSSNWEQVHLPGEPAAFLWIWFKPPTAPQGLFVRIPDEWLRGATGRSPPSLRFLLQSTGIDLRSVSVCYIYGHPLDTMQGMNPALDYPIPAPPAGADPTITVLLQAFPPPVAAAAPAQPNYTAAPPTQSSGLFAKIEADWNGILLIENHQDTARKQLNAMQVRLNSLNRDLNVEEARAADSADRVDWQEARRWLRDVAARVARFIKEHDVGMTSNAGLRLRFESIYKDQIVPRRPFAGIEQVAREFEMHRKTMQHLLANMQTALAQAANDGERRAQMVLSRIASKVRALRTKRGS